MREPIAFSTLLTEAFRLAKLRTFHLPYLLLLGILASASYFVTTKLTPFTPLPGSEAVEEWMPWVSHNVSFVFIFFGVSVLFVLTQAFLRGPLVLTLETSLLASTSKTKGPALTQKRLLEAGRTSLLLELGYELVSFLFFVLIFLPVLFAFRYNQNALSPIFEISLFLYLTLITLFYFIREYTLYYRLLGSLRFFSALELGYALFLKNFTQSLLFGALLLGLSFVFTFLIDSAMLLSASLFKSSFFVSVLFLFLLSGVFGVFREALRLLFFHSIAAEEKKKERVPEPVVESAPDLPPVS